VPPGRCRAAVRPEVTVLTAFGRFNRFAQISPVYYILPRYQVSSERRRVAYDLSYLGLKLAGLADRFNRFGSIRTGAAGRGGGRTQGRPRTGRPYGQVM